MQLTDYHAKYFAYELIKRCAPDSMEKLAGAVAGAQVDLNPHQVDAALFAFNSPLSKGALLADEVGLGKTIEAGLVLSQKWAERKRRILIITPSNLRKQWHQEMSEKFFLPCEILETKPYNAAIKTGNFKPFEMQDAIVICSYQFARNKAADVANTPWDLVVIDEAHRLRNVYKPSNVIANTLKQALKDRHKLLLTATPLQNSLLELFGLVGFIDELVFGDLKSFREQYSNLNQEQVFLTLKERLKPVCHRTLRRQVTSYIPFTKRHPLVEEFTPEEGEDRLYHLVSDYLQRDNLQALPASQRSLMTLVLRKLLASSTFAIAGALTSISNRLKAKLRKQALARSLEDELDEDYEALDETAEEWEEDEVAELLSNANITILPADGSDPVSIVRHALKLFQRAEGGYDRVYCVFDRDGHVNYQQALDQVAKSPLGKKGRLFAITSVPCFEFWVLLHFEYTAAPFTAVGGKSACDRVIERVCTHFPGYRKAMNGIYEKLQLRADAAITHAARLAHHNHETGTSNPATKVHELVTYLRGLKK